MTPEQITDALGTGWEQTEDRAEWWHGEHVAVGPYPAPDDDRWWVDYCKDWAETRFDCPTPEAAVAVAHLLVAAERIAAGARVAPSGLDLWRPGVAGGKPAVYQGDRFMFTHEARRRALGLLRAADAADLTANSR